MHTCKYSSHARLACSERDHEVQPRVSFCVCGSPCLLVENRSLISSQSSPMMPGLAANILSHWLLHGVAGLAWSSGKSSDESKYQPRRVPPFEATHSPPNSKSEASFVARVNNPSHGLTLPNTGRFRRAGFLSPFSRWLLVYG